MKNEVSTISAMVKIEELPNYFNEYILSYEKDNKRMLSDIPCFLEISSDDSINFMIYLSFEKEASEIETQLIVFNSNDFIDYVIEYTSIDDSIGYDEAYTDAYKEIAEMKNLIRLKAIHELTKSMAKESAAICINKR